MTLIARTTNYNFPFLIGDILFSSTRINPDVRFPSGLLLEQVATERTLYPSDLLQKIYIIDPTIAIAMAGLEYEMRTLLEGLRERAALAELTVEGIQSFLEEFDLGTNYADSSFLIIKMRRDQNEIQVKEFPHGKWATTLTENFENVAASGSGAHEFINQFNQPAKYVTSSMRGTPQAAIALNLGLMARWLAIEKTTGLPTRNNWGAGFESIYFDGHAFQKTNETAFAIFEQNYNADGSVPLPIPTTLNYYGYYKENLFIVSIRIYQGQCSQAHDHYEWYTENFDARIYPVLSIENKSDNVLMPPDYSFMTHRLALGYGIRKQTSIATPSLFSESSDMWVNYKHNQSLTLRMPTMMNDAVVKGLEDVYEKI
jgi:hypothetical protein